MDGLMVELRREAVTAELIREAMPLFEAHAAAATPWMAQFSPSSTFNDYPTLESLGRLRFFAARLDGVLVGYNVLMIQPVPGYDGREQAVEMGIYVTPEHRGTIGFGLLSFSENQMASENIVAIHRFVPTGSAYGRKLAGAGYEPTATLFTKGIPHEA